MAENPSPFQTTRQIQKPPLTPLHFPILFLLLTLQNISNSHPHFSVIYSSYQQHLANLNSIPLTLSHYQIIHITHLFLPLFLFSLSSATQHFPIPSLSHNPHPTNTISCQYLQILLLHKYL